VEFKTVVKHFGVGLVCDTGVDCEHDYDYELDYKHEHEDPARRAGPFTQGFISWN
jgi:hypothetical protein